jgi:serine-type D-Ala-D-Ala carboxypeptidase/endopeptidase (penicillin-binding protein 4)
MVQKLFCLLLVATLAFSCSPVSKKELNRTFRKTEADFKDHTGFMLYDQNENKTIYEYNAAVYFTPASNIKILTLYTSLKILGDSVPGLRYVVRGDSLIFWGTGDPSFLYRNAYSNDRVYSFLKLTDKNLFLSTSNFNATHYGPGWAWDDYADSYSVERSPFPVYGNLFSIKGNGTAMEIEPPFFMRYLTPGGQAERASATRNLDNIPFKVNPTLTSQLLTDTLKKSVQLTDITMPGNAKLLNSIPVDSLYRVLMQDSDNFIAEQLLLLCSGIISDTLRSEIAIQYSQKTFMQNLTDKPIWVDGSGLSRYNLLTPRSTVQLWKEIYSLMPRERLFSLLATGGKSGTIRNWYNGDKPYVFGKTGSLMHNHCLSGYLVTRSGKTLIFSFMNSNFTASVNDVRKNMQSILNLIYENY